MAKAQNEKTIFISSLLLLLCATVSAQKFIIKDVIREANAIEITLLNTSDSAIYVPKFSLRRTAKEKCNIDYLSYENDTLYLIFKREAPECLKGSIVAHKNSDGSSNGIKYVDKLLKPNECYKQTIVLEKRVDFKYLQLTYDAYTVSFEKIK